MLNRSNQSQPWLLPNLTPNAHLALHCRQPLIYRWVETVGRKTNWAHTMGPRLWCLLIKTMCKYIIVKSICKRKPQPQIRQTNIDCEVVLKFRYDFIWLFPHCGFIKSCLDVSWTRTWSSKKRNHTVKKEEKRKYQPFMITAAWSHSIEHRWNMIIFR